MDHDHYIHAHIHRALGPTTFVLQLEGSPGLVRASCTSMNLQEPELFGILCTTEKGGRTRWSNGSVRQGELVLRSDRPVTTTYGYADGGPVPVSIALGPFSFSSSSYIQCRLTHPRPPTDKEISGQGRKRKCAEINTKDPTAETLNSGMLEDPASPL